MFTLLKQGMAVFLAISIAVPLQSTVLIAYAQSAAPGSGDLTSTNQTESAAVHGEFGAAAITVGGNSVNVTPQSMLTPAELAALTQVLTSGQQTLQLNELGAAVAGQLNLHTDLSAQISNLVIPQGVTALHDAAFMQSLNLNQNLTNFGSFFAYTTNPDITNFTVNAASIYNTSGATLSSILPTYLSATGMAPYLNLSLNAVNDIINAGTISSSGNLALSAQSIVNTGQLYSAMNMSMTAASIQNMASATMVAQQAMQANTAVLVNSGLMSAMQGTLAINNLDPTHALSILNEGGALKALNAQLSISSLHGIDINGGSLLGDTINLNGQNHVRGNVESMQGPVSVKATDVALSSQSDLNIASLDVTGDPFFSCAGCGLTLAAGGVAGQPYTALAGTTITLTGNIVGSEIYLISGANFTQNACSGCATPTTTITSQSTGDFGIDLGSNTVSGSNVNILSAGDITSSSGSSVTATGTVTMQAKGNVQLQDSSGLATVVRTSSTTFSNLTFADSRCITCVSGTRTSGTFGAGAVLANNITTSGNVSATTLTVSTGTLSIDSGKLMSGSGNVTLNVSTLTNNGTVRTTNTNGTVTVQSTGALTVNGSGGTIATNGTGTGTITLSTTGATALNVDSSVTFDTLGAGNVNLRSQAVGGSINIASGVVVNADGSAVTLSAPTLFLNDGSTITTTRATGTAITVNSGTAVAPLNISVADGATASLDTAGGAIAITATSGQALSFSKTAGSGSATLALSDGNATVTSTNTNTSVATGLSVTNNRSVTFTAQNSTFTNDGTISTVGAGSNVTVQSTVASGNLTVNNNGNISSGGSLTLSTGGSGASLAVNNNGSISSGSTFTVQTVPTGGVGGTLSLDNNGSMSAGTSMILQNTGANGGGNFTFTNDGTMTSGTTMTVTNSTLNGSLNFANNSLIQSGTALIIQNTGINGSASVQNYGTLAAGTGNSLIRNTGASGNLNLTQAGNITTTGSAANLTIDQTGANGSSTVVNSGSMNIAGSLTIQTNPAGGNGGTLSLTNTSTGTMSAGSAVLFQNLGAVSGGNFTFTNDGSVSAGTTMTLTNSAFGGSFNFDNNSTMTASTAMTVQNSATNGLLNFNNGGSLSSTTSSMMIQNTSTGGSNNFDNNGTMTAATTMTVQNTGAGGSLIATNDGTMSSNGNLAVRNSGANGALDFTQNNVLTSGAVITIEQTGANGTATVTNNGTISSTGTTVGGITIQNTQGDLTFGGAGSLSTLEDPSLASLHILLEAGSLTLAANLNITSSHTFTTNTTDGEVGYYARGTGGAVNLAAGSTQTVLGQLSVFSPNITPGAGATLNVDRTTGNAVRFQTTGTGNDLIFNLPDNSSFTVNTTGGGITVGNNAAVSTIFTKTSGSGTTAFNAFGGNLDVNSASLTDVQAAVTVLANRNITFGQLSYGGVTRINGTIESTATGDYVYINNVPTGTSGSINFDLGGQLVVDGKTYTEGTIEGNGRVIQSGAGSPIIFVQKPGNGNITHHLIFDGNLTFSAGPNGSVYFKSFGNTGWQGVTELTDNSTINITGGSFLVLAQPILQMGANSVINVDRATGDAVKFASNWVGYDFNDFLSNPLHGGWLGRAVLGTEGSQATISTTGGRILMNDCCSAPMLFSTVSGNGTTTINLLGGDVSMPLQNITIDSGVTIQANRNISMTTAWIPYYSDPLSGTIVNNGLVTTSANNGSISLSFNTGGNSPFGSTNIMGNGKFEVTGSNGQITVSETSANQTLIFSGNLTFDPGSSGSVTFRATAAGSGLAFAANSVQTIASGAPLTLTAPNLTMYSNSLIDVQKSSGTAVTMNSGSSTRPMVVTIEAGSQSTIQTAGGTFNITQSVDQNLTFANTNASGPLAVLNLNGGNVFMTTSGTASTTINPYVCVACDNDINISGTFINNGGCLESDANINFTGISGFTNNGDISAQGSINLSTSGNLSIIGSGTLDSPAINLTSTDGSIYVDQGSVIGALNGYAATSIELWIDSDLYIGDLTAQTVTAQAGGHLQVDGDVNMTLNDGYPFPVTMSSASIDINGTITAPNGRVQLYANDNNILMGLGDSPTGNGAQFYLSEDELNRITTPTLQIGGWFLDGGFLVTGEIDLSNANFTNLWLSSGGNGNDGGTYTGTGSTITMNSSQNIGVTANNIYTGSVTGGGYGGWTATNQITVDGAILMLGTDSYPFPVTMTGTDLDVTATGSVSAPNGRIQVYPNDANISMGLGDTAASNGAQFYLSEDELNRFTTPTLSIGGWWFDSAVTVTGDIDISNANIGNLWISSGGNGNDGGTYTGTGSTITMNSSQNIGVTANNIYTGSVTGGGYGGWTATNQITVDGAILMLGTDSYPFPVTMTGADLDVTATGSVTAPNGRIQVYPNDANISMGLGDTAASNGAQFYLSEDELNRFSTPTLSIGGWWFDSAVTVTGDIDISNANIGNLWISSGGNGNDGGTYTGTGSTITMNSSQNIGVTANNIYTGSVTGGGYGGWTATNQITVDGAILMLGTDGYPFPVTMTGADLDVTATGSVTAPNGRIQVYPNDPNASMGLGDTAASNGAQFYLSEDELNRFSTPTLSIGGWWFDSAVTVTGDIDISNANISNLWISSGGNGNDGGTFTGTGSTLRMDCDQALSVTAQNINTGNVVAHNPAFNITTGALTVDGFLLDSCALCATSLDLTNAANVNQLVGLQTLGYLGGTLQVSGGVAVGGDLILNPCGSGCELTAVNVPTNVLVTFEGFDTTPVNVTLTESSTTGTFILGGTMNFDGTSGLFNITTYLNQPAMQVSDSGLITADGSLTVNINGDVSVAGTMAATGNLVLNATGSNQTVAISGTLTATQDLQLVYNGGGNKVLDLSGNMTADKVLLQWNTQGGGSFTMNGNDGSLNANQSINFDFCCYYQPTTTTLNFNGTADFNVSNDQGAIAIGSWCCSTAQMNWNGNYNLNASGDNSSISIFLGDEVNLNNENTFTVGNNGSVLLGSYYADTFINQAQTFNTGDNSTVNLVGGYYGGNYNGNLYVNASNEYNIGNSTVYFSAGDTVAFGAGTTQNVAEDLVVRYGGGAAWGGPDKGLTLGTGASLNANTILVQWNSVLGGNFTMNSDGGTLNANQSIAFDFCCYYQPTTTTFDFNGTATMNVANDNGSISVGSWCCSEAQMNFNGNYDLNATGANSSINVFLGDEVNLNATNTFSVGDNGSIFVGSYYTDMHVNAAQTFNTGADSTVTLSGGSYGGMYDGGLYVDASNDYNLGSGSTVTFRGGGLVEFGAGTTQSVAGEMHIEFYGGTTSGYSNKDLVLNAGAALNADNILVQWNSVGGGNFTMNSDNGTMTATQSINFDFCCYYQPTPNTFNFEGTANMNVSGDNGLIQMGAWCCSSGSMNLNGEYSLTASGNNSDINIFLGDQVSLNGENTFTVGDDGNIRVGSLYTTTNVNGLSTFNTGANSQVTVSAGQVLNLNADTVFTTGTGSNIDVTTGCANGAINVASETTHTANGANTFDFATNVLTLNGGALVQSTGNISLAQHVLVNNGATVSSTGDGTTITLLNCCTSDLILEGSGGSIQANGSGSQILLTAASVTNTGDYHFSSDAGMTFTTSVVNFSGNNTIDGTVHFDYGSNMTVTYNGTLVIGDSSVAGVLNVTTTDGIELIGNLSAGSVTLQSCPLVEIDSAATLSSTGNITITTGLLSNNGTITTSGSSATILCQECGSGLTLTGDGNGVFSATGTGSTQVNLLVSSDSSLTLASSFDFNAGNVYFNAQAVGASVDLGANTTQDVTGVLNLLTQHLSAGANTQINVNKASGIAFFANPGSTGNLLVSLPDNSAFTVQTTGGDIWIGSYAPSVTFENSGNTGTATFNAFGGPLTVVVANAITVEEGVTLAANTGNMSLVTNTPSGNPTITIDGTVTSSAAGNYTYDSINSYTGTSGLILIATSMGNGGYNGPSEFGPQGYIAGNGSVIQTGTGTPLISFSGACCDPHEVHFTGDLTANAGAAGRVYIDHPGYVFEAPVSTIFEDNASLNVTGQSMLVVRTAMVKMSDGSSINVDRTTGTAIDFTGNFVSQRAILIEDGGSATISSGGGTIALSSCCSNSMTFGSFVDGQAVPLVHQVNYPGVAVTDYYNIAPTAATSTTTLNLAGGNVTVGAATITVNDNMVLSANKNVTMAPFWNQYYDNPGTLTNNGLVTTSNPNGSVTLSFTGSATGPNFLYGDGTFSATGGGTSSIVVTEASSNGNLTFGGSMIYDAGATGTVTFGSTTSGSTTGLTFASNTTQTVVGGAPLTISAARVAFGDDSLIDVQRTTGTAVTIQPGTPRQMVITAPGNGEATIHTAGGNFVFSNFFQQPVTFATSGSAPGTLNLEGGTVTVSNPNITVNSGFTLQSDNNITISASYNNTCSGCTTLPNLGLVNNGTITTSRTNGVITYNLASTSTNQGYLAGSGVFSVTGGGTAAINITNSTSLGTLNVTGSHTYDPGATGAVTFTSNAAGSRINFEDNSTQHVASGAPLTISTPNLQFGANAELIVDRATGTAVTINDGSGSNNMVITLEAGSTASITTLGGAINISPTPSSQSVTFANSAGVGPMATLEFNGGVANITTSGAGTTTVNSFVTIASTYTNNLCCGTIKFTANNMATQANSLITGVDNLYVFANNFNHNGAIVTSDTNGDNFGTSIGIIDNNGPALTMTGNGSFTAAGGTINVQVDSTSVLNVNGSFTYSTGSSGVVFQSLSSATAVNFGANTTQTINNSNGAPVNIYSNQISFADDTVIDVNGTSGINLRSSASQPLTIVAPSGGTAEIITAGGTIQVLPSSGQSVSFVNANATGALATLELNGGAVEVKPSGTGAINVATNLTLSSDNSVLLRAPAGVNISSGSTVASEDFINVTTNFLDLNGLLAVSGTVGNSNGQTIVVTDNNNLGVTLTGTGSLVAAGGQVVLQAFGPAPLNLFGNYDISTSGRVVIQGVISGTSYTAPINFGANTTTTVSTGENLLIETPSLSFGANAVINVNKSTGVAVYINPADAGDMTITMDAGSAATIQTAGGEIIVSQWYADRNITFANSNPAGPLAVLNLNGGDVFMTTSGTGITTINPYVCVACDNDLTVTGNFLNNGGCLETAGNLTFNNTSTLTNNGTLEAGGMLTVTNSGNVTITGTGTLDATTITLTSINGSVNASQGAYTGLVDGSATTTFDVVSGSSLATGNISATDISLSATTNLNLNGNLTAGNSTDLSAGDDVAQGAGYTISTSSLDVSAGNSIGTSNNALDTNADNLTANAGSNSYIYVDGSVNVGSSSAGGTFDLNANGAMNVNGALTANDVVLTTSAMDADMTLNANVAADNSVTISTTGCDALLTNNANLTAGTAANSGSITLNTANVDNNAGATISALGPAGSIDINCPTCNTTVANDGTISSTGDVSISSGFGDVNLSGNGTTSADTTTLTAVGNVTASQADFNGTLGGSAGGSFTVVSGSDLTSGAINATDISLQATTTLDVNGSLNASNDLSLVAGSNLSFNNTVTAGGDLSAQTTSNGNIVIDSDLTSGNSMTLAANGTGSISNSNGSMLFAATLDVSSDSGNLGSADNYLLTSADNVSANTAGNVYLAGSGSVVLETSSGDSFNVFAAGDITTAGSVSGTNITLGTMDGDNTITLNSSVSANTSVNLLGTGGDLTVNNLSNADTLGTLLVMNEGGDLLTTNSGTVNAGTLTIVDAGGSATVNNVGSLMVAGDLSLLSDGNVALTGTGSTSAGGDVLLISNTGSVTLTQASVSGTVTGYAGTSFSATTTASSLTTASITTEHGAITLNAAQSLNIHDASVLDACGDITLTGKTGVNVGTVGGQGVYINAGHFVDGFVIDPLNPYQLLAAGCVECNGSVLIDTYLGGNSSGNVVMGDNVNIISHGAATEGGQVGDGHIGIRSGGSITTGVNTTLAGWGGDTWVSANTTVTFGTNALITSVAKYDDGGSGETYGGGVGIFAGLVNQDVQAKVDTALGRTSNSNNIVMPNKKFFNTSTDTISVTNGGDLQILMPSNTVVTSIHHDTFLVNGGAIIIQEATAANTITLAYSTVVAVDGSTSAGNNPNFPGGGVTRGIFPQNFPFPAAGKTPAGPINVTTYPGEFEGGIFPGGGATEGTFNGNQGGNQPIAFTPATAPKLQTLIALSGDSQIKHIGDADVSERNAGELILNNGEILVTASENLAIKAGSMVVTMKPGTIGLIAKHGQHVAVRAIYGHGAQALRVYVDGITLNLNTGEEASLANNQGVTATYHVADGIGRRKAHKYDLGTGRALTQAEISLFTLVEKSPVLRHICKSKDVGDRAITDKLVKTAAALHVITSSHGAYDNK